MATAVLYITLAGWPVPTILAAPFLVAQHLVKAESAYQDKVAQEAVERTIKNTESYHR